MKSAVIVFPGSNCDRDAQTAISAVGYSEPEMVWHADNALPRVDLVVVPGGFSYGDYLRSGAMAAHSPIMREVKAHAERGGLVLGICNGFQILTEAGLLPGVLLRNRRLKFICRPVWVRVENTSTAFTKNYTPGQLLSIPIAHNEGNYYADEATLRKLEDDGCVAFRYCDEKGDVRDDDVANPNGAMHNIAGILNERKNVLGMMPHPERHADPATGGTDGVALFTSLLH
jgi:phosphoribosylformylglycinamidine synthase I